MAHRFVTTLTISTVSSSGAEVPVGDYLDPSSTYTLAPNQSSGVTMFLSRPGATPAASGVSILSGDGQAAPIERLRVRDGNPYLYADDAGPLTCVLDLFEVV